MLEQLTDLLLNLIDQFGLIGIFLAAVIESLFAPIPSEIVLFTAGLYAKTQGGVDQVFWIACAATLGSYFGTLPFYLISRFSRDKLLPLFIRKFGVYLLITETEIDKAETLFESRGRFMVFAARLIPGIRSLIAFPAGVAKMNFIVYTLYTFAGSFLWNLFLVAFGYLAYDSKDKFFTVLEPVENLIVLLLVAAAAIYIYKVAKQILQLRAQAGE